ARRVSEYNGFARPRRVYLRTSRGSPCSDYPSTIRHKGSITRASGGWSARGRLGYCRSHFARTRTTARITLAIPGGAQATPGLVLAYSIQRYRRHRDVPIPTHRHPVYPVLTFFEAMARHNNGVNLTVWPVTRLASRSDHRHERWRAQGARPSQPAGYAGRYA